MRREAGAAGFIRRCGAGWERDSGKFRVELGERSVGLIGVINEGWVCNADSRVGFLLLTGI